LWKGIFNSVNRKRPLSSAKSKHQAGSDNFIPYLDNFSANFKAVCPQAEQLPFWFLVLDNIIDMFPENGFEVQFIGCIKISRNCFWITVNHNGFITLLRS
jgi:hypothetical protein